MSKLILIALLVAGIAGSTPGFAAPSSDTIGRGCTLDPFNHTQRCIDFDHCTKNRNGQTVCPVVVTTTRAQEPL